MRVFICGPDGAGKTTLAKKLAKEWGLNYKHFCRPSVDEVNNQQQMYIDAILAEDNVIFDRNWICAKVYGEVMRNTVEITAAEIAAIELAALAAGPCLLIHCTDNTDKLWERCNERGEEYVTARSQLHTIRLSYHKAVRKSLLPTVEYYVNISDFGE